MQSLLSSHRPQAARKPCLNSHNRVHGRKLVSVEGGDCSKRSIFLGVPLASAEDLPSTERVLTGKALKEWFLSGRPPNHQSKPPAAGSLANLVGVAFEKPAFVK